MDKKKIFESVKNTAGKAVSIANDAKNFAVDKTVTAVEVAKDFTTNKIDELKSNITEEDVMNTLTQVYEKAVNGVPGISKPIEQLANEYMEKNKDVESSIKQFIDYQVVKCGVSGFLTGLGGLITLPVAIPANVASVWYVQVRMIAAIAVMGGFDCMSDQVQTLTFACLAGTGITDALKQAGVKIGEKLATNSLQKLSGEVIKSINRVVGFRLVTKFGEKGVVNLGKLIPLVGGVIGGGMDVVATNIIANNAYSLFVNKEIPNYEVME